MKKKTEKNRRRRDRETERDRGRERERKRDVCGLSRDTRPRGRRDVFRGLRGATGAAAWPQTSVPVALALLVQRHPHRDALSMLTHLCPRPATSLSLSLDYRRLLLRIHASVPSRVSFVVRVIVLSFFLLFHSLSCSYTSRSRSRSRKMSRGFLSMSIKEREREWRKHRLDANRNCGENHLKYSFSWYFSGNIKALRVLSTRGPRSLLSRGN